MDDVLCERFAFFEHEDLVRVDDGADALCDDERGAAFHQRVERGLDLRFGGEINGRG